MAFWFWNRKSDESEKLGKYIKESSETLAKTITEASKDEIKARDRVDITLEEYERLKEENRLLQIKVKDLYMILDSFHFPVNLYKRVKVDTIKTSVCHNVRDFIDTVRIEFDVDVPYPYGEDYDY